MCHGKVVNVILNSINRVSGNTSVANYTIDWGSILKNNQAYTLSFTYIGGINVVNGAKIACLYADLETSNKQNSATSFGASSSQMLGFLKPSQFAPNQNTNYLHAETNTNISSYLEGRPRNNNFTISILDNATTPIPFTDSTPSNPAPYILVLSFREVDSAK